MAITKLTTYQYLPDFKASPILTNPLQLSGNGIVTATNTTNTILDITAPLGLAGNQVFGKPFQAIHKEGDQIINGISNATNGIGQSLGATTKPNDTHYKNEWIDQDITLKNILNLPSEIIGNALIGGTNIANDILDTTAPLGQAGNNIFGSGFGSLHQVGDAIIHQVSEIIIINAGQTLGGTIQPNDTHYNNEWQAQSIVANNSAPVSALSTKAIKANNSTYQADNGQKSYFVSEATLNRVKELYEQYNQVVNQKVNNLWRPIYTVIAEDLKSNTAIDQGTKNWFHVAEAVATADPKSILYQYVRLGTQKALNAKGIYFTDGEFYQASNVLVKTLATNLINGVIDVDGNTIIPAGYVPSAAGLNGLVHMDATQALQNLGGTLADWTGITPFGLLDHLLGVDTSVMNGGDSRPISWYLELLGDVVKATLKAGVSLPDLISQFVNEGLSYVELLIEGEVLQNGFSSKDQLVNTLTQLAYAYAGDLAGPVAFATNVFNQDTNLVTNYLPFGTTLNGKDGRDVINGNIGNDKLYGGKGDDLLFGNWGNDILDGGEGINVLVGGRENDTYYVRSNSDFVLEHKGEGTDIVLSTAKHFYLTSNVENLTLIGAENISGSGNDLSNIIKGNTGENHLYGLGGDDTLEAIGSLYNLLNGGIGNDKLLGGTGNETYEFELGFGQDIIQEKGGDDRIKLGKHIDLNDLLISNVGADKIISIKGTTDQIIIKNAAKGSQYQVESIQFDNGDRLDLKTLDYQQHYYF